MNWRLQLLVLAQAIDDLIIDEFESSLDEDDLASAEAYLADYPDLLRRVWERRDLERWRQEINQAREDLVAALEERNRV